MKAAFVALLMASATCSGACRAEAIAPASLPAAGSSAYPVVNAFTGSDREMPLRYAVAAIVPRDYTVRSESIIRLYPSPVSWRGGSDWTEVLKTALSPYPQVLIFINKQDKTVTLRLRGDMGTRDAVDMAAAPARTVPAPVQATATAAASPAPTPAAAPAQTRTGVSAPTPTASPASPGGAPAPVATALTQPPAEPVWLIRIEDRSLRAVFARWTESAGWQLSWEAPVDYAIDARATLTGSLESAVEAVVKSLFKVDVPVKAIFYRGNKVLRVVAKGAE